MAADTDNQAVPWRTIPELVRWAGEQFAGLEAIGDGDTRITYGELTTHVTDAARAFAAAGVEPGDVVAIWAPNMPEWEIALLGAQSAGAVVVPLNTRFKGTEAAYILNRSRAKVLVTVNGFLGNDYLGMLADQDIPGVEHRVVLRGDTPAGAVSWADFLAAGADVPESEIDRRLAAMGPDDVADLLFTSGTTGHPKGVPGRHGQILRAFRTWATIAGVRPGDRYLLVNPMFHSFGYRAGILACVMSGAALIPVSVFDVDVVFELIQKEKISVIPGPPTLYQSILNHPGLASADLSSLRLAVTGAAAIPVQLVERMRKELGFETVITAYGLTESMGFLTICRPDDDAETIATTSGRAIPDVDVRVVDENGAEVPRGEPGEIVAKGYVLMSGYFEEPEQTAEAIDAKGWLHTGDIGVMDERGNVRITDRKKDMFIVGGFNAYPVEIENLLGDNPKIAQVAVIGVPDERMGEVGAAFVVLRRGETATPEELIAWSRDHMANYKVPRKVEIVDSLPLNASGKVVKYELREQALKAMEANA